MKNKPNKTADVCDLSAAAEHTVLYGHIRQTLKQVEDNVIAHEPGRPTVARFARREYSLLQPTPRQRQACSLCPHRLGHDSFCCG